jgi:hypothetical protein
VICDKPATTTLAQAHELAAIVEEGGQTLRPDLYLFRLSLVREARARIAAGALGPIRKVVVEYPQGWLAKPDTGKQAMAWRSGAIRHWRMRGGHRRPCLPSGRIRHRLAVTQICRSGHGGSGPPVDDDCQILLRFDNGARPCWPARFRWVNATA